MNPLDIQLITHSDCRLTSIYQSDNIDNNSDNVYNTEYVSVEYLEFKGKGDDMSVVIKVCDNTELVLSHTEFALLHDGVYTYFRYLVPKLSWLAEESEIINGKIYYGKICLNKQLFYYNSKFYFCNSNDIEDIHMTLDEVLLTYADEIVKNSVELKSIYDLQKYIDAAPIGTSQTFYCKKNVFTYCNLIKCFVSLQSKITKQLCNGTCESLSTDVDNRNFLLSTIYTLDYLRDINNFVEAQRIIDNISECGGICDSYYNNDCGCYA